jgi:DNA-binding NarL/FixJ family response regulator
MNASKIKVIIADDHDLYRAGFKMLLEDDDEIEVVAEASNGAELIQQARQYCPDVIVTDLMMPGTDGVQAIKEIHKTGAIRMIALSTFDSEHLIVEALEAGALGYIIKNAQNGEIIEAIKTVSSYAPYYCKSTNSRLVRMISKSKFNPYTRESLDLFSEKEKEIIRLVCQEKSSEEIGKLLFMSKRTVDGIRAKILSKMGVKTVAGVAIYAIKNSIFFLDSANIQNA